MGKQKLEEKPIFCRKGAYVTTDELPGTLIHLPTLVLTSPMALGESFLPSHDLSVQRGQQCCIIFPKYFDKRAVI